jgi:molecular chaperone GrpE
MTRSTKDKQSKKQAEADMPDTDAATSEEVESLQARVEELEAELAGAHDARQRALADFTNYQRRALLNESAARKAGASRVVECLLTLADHLDMALMQDPANVSAAAVMDGVSLIRDELSRILTEHGVSAINPEPGEEHDPARHDALGIMPVEGVDAGHIARVEQPGYEMGGRVVRPAKVFLAPGEAVDVVDDDVDEEASDADV